MPLELFDEVLERVRQAITGPGTNAGASPSLAWSLHKMLPRSECVATAVRVHTRSLDSHNICECFKPKQAVAKCLAITRERTREEESAWLLVIPWSELYDPSLLPPSECGELLFLFLEHTLWNERGSYNMKMYPWSVLTWLHIHSRRYFSLSLPRLQMDMLEKWKKKDPTITFLIVIREDMK